MLIQIYFCYTHKNEMWFYNLMFRILEFAFKTSVYFPLGQVTRERNRWEGRFWGVCALMGENLRVGINFYPEQYQGEAI